MLNFFIFIKPRLRFMEKSTSEFAIWIFLVRFAKGEDVFAFEWGKGRWISVVAARRWGWKRLCCCGCSALLVLCMAFCVILSVM